MKNSKKTFMSMSTIVFTLLLFILLTISSQTKADPNRDMTERYILNIEENSITIQPAFGINVTARVHCRISAIIPADEDTVFVPRIDNSWALSTFPDPVVMKKGRSHTDFVLYITVPYNTTAGAYISYVDAFAMNEGINEKVKGDYISIKIMQYAFFSIGFDRNVSEITMVGGENQIECYITNLGNSVDSFTFSLLNPVTDDFEVSLSPTKTQLIHPNQIATVSIVFKMNRWIQGFYTLDFNVRSNTNENISQIVYLRAYIYESRGFLVIGQKSILYITRPNGKFILDPSENLHTDIDIYCFLSPARDVNISVINGKSMVSYYVGNLSEGMVKRYTLNINHSSLLISSRITGNNYTTIIIYARGTNTEISNIRTVVVIFRENENKAVRSVSVPTLMATTIIITATFVGLGGSMYMYSERYRSAMLLILVPLYSRIREDNILNHFIRGRIYEYLRENPGAHFSEIRRVLGLSNGECAYHLYRLEKTYLIKSRYDGRLKRYYITGVKITPEIYGIEDGIKRKILHLIKISPGITETEIASRIKDRKERTIKHYIKNMERNGEIILVRDGKNKRCYISEMDISDASETKRSIVDGRAHQDMI